MLTHLDAFSARLVRCGLLVVCLGWPQDSAARTPQTAGAGRPPAASTPVLDRIWEGVRQAQKHTTMCGRVIETRTSPLLARPLKLSGTFCVQGTTGFRQSSADPEPLTIVYHDRYVNVVHVRERRTEAFEAGSGVGRAMEYFGPTGSIENSYVRNGSKTDLRRRLTEPPLSSAGQAGME